MNSIEETRDPRETTGIKAVLILEVIGRPPEHLTETLNDLVKKIGEEKGLIIERYKVNEPILMKDSKDFYTNFAEVEIEVEEISILSLLVFKYMPAHIEIISPELISLTNNGWNDVLNETLLKLHGYDEVARIIQMQTAQTQRKLKELKEKYPEEFPEEK